MRVLAILVLLSGVTCLTAFDTSCASKKPKPSAQRRFRVRASCITNAACVGSYHTLETGEIQCTDFRFTADCIEYPRQ